MSPCDSEVLLSIKDIMAADINQPAPESEPTRYEPRDQRFGPYLLMPRHRVLAEIAAPRTVTRYRYDVVALYDDVPAFLATDAVKLVTVPISKFDGSGAPTPPAVIRSTLGRSTFLLPTKLFEEIPEEIPAGQSHVEMTIAYDWKHKDWFAEVSVQPMPAVAGGVKRYKLGYGLKPNEADAHWPSYHAIESMLDRTYKSANKVITFDTEFLNALTRAIGTRAITVHLNGRTGGMRIEPTGEVDDDYGIHAVGLLMPITEDDDHDWDLTERCRGGAC